MMNFLEERNKKRDILQRELDGQKTQEERNAMGQFATPYPLACDIMTKVKSLCPDGKVSFLEPSIGLGSFYAAFLSVFGHRVGNSLGFEIDPFYCQSACELWNGENLEIENSDFLQEMPGQRKFSLLVANPPYVRHHHIDVQRKKQLQNEVLRETGIRISGLAGLYCYFLLLADKWLVDGGLSCWLIPSEFMDVNYGKAIKQYLLEKVDLIGVHRFGSENVQFADALVTSSVVFFKKQKPSDHVVSLTSGPNLNAPTDSFKVEKSKLGHTAKWSRLFGDEMDEVCEPSCCRLGDFFSVKRGVATGDNRFFVIDRKIADEYCIPAKFLKPVLPSPRFFVGDKVTSNDDGRVSVDKELYLFSCNIPEGILKNKYPSVWNYVQEGVRRGVDKGYICSHRQIWYSCEDRKPALFVVPYMGRGDTSKKMFRFILNQSEAITTNVYLLLYPKGQFANCFRDPIVVDGVWNALNSVPVECLVANGREYGGGLHKIEPKELLNVPVPEVASLLQTMQLSMEPTLF